MSHMRLLAATATALLLAAPAGAFAPQERSLAQEIPVPGSERAARVAFVQSTDPRVAGFTARFGGRWSVDWNEATGTPHMILGGGATAAGPVASAEAAEAAAREIVASNPDLFATTLADLAVVAVQHATGKWAVHFGQRYQGLPVELGSAFVVLTEEGRLMALGSDVYPVRGLSPFPALSREAAVRRAADPVAYDGVGDEVTGTELVVLPLDLSEGLEYRLAWRVDLQVDEPLGDWRSYVDAERGTILARENRVRSATMSGTVGADVQFTSYCDGTSSLPMAYETVTVVGQGSTVTDANGAWSLTVPAGPSYTVQTQLSGSWVNVNVAGTPPDASFSGPGVPGTPLAIYWNDANARKDERDGFYSVNHVHSKIKQIDPTFTGVDYVMICNVGRTDGYCPGNAWWDGTNINFCDPGSGYANTAEIGNVVWHEYTHGITDKMYGANDPPSDIHEGNSDVMACYLQDVSIVGIGFYQGNCTGGIRNLNNSLRYPDDLSGEGHFDGQILGGFHWDARQLLEASIGQPAADSVAYRIWHFGRKLGLPQTQPDQVEWTFIADDDNGNLTDGTPHYDELCAAATNHGFEAPPIVREVTIAHTPLATTTDPYRVHLLRAVVSSTAGPIDPDSVLVYYRTNGGPFTELPMSFVPGPSEYQATIPFQQQTTEIAYYILAVDALGHRETSPGGCVLGYHEFDVAWAFDNLEVASGWTAGVPGDDATTGIWERVDPIGTGAQPENDHTPAPGTLCYVTENGTPGGSIGEADVDGGRTTLLSPVFNVSGGTEVDVKYYRWYTNDAGNDPNNDYWVVDLSNDGGTSYTNIENTLQSDHFWRGVRFPLATHFPVPGQVRVRFIASDLGSGSVVEAGVDDFTILANFGAGTAVEAAGTAPGVPDRYALKPASPNPFNPRTAIAYDLPRESRVNLAVYDVQGRVVRALVATTQPGGHYAVIWDGKDASGQTVASGVYFSRLQANEFMQTQKMVLTK